MLSRDITKTVYKVSDFLTWQRADLLVLSPYFQRRPVWPAGAKSYLLDTIIRGLPIPIVFLRERKTNLKSLENIKEVVDGQQRIRTLFSFVSSSLLKDFNPDRDRFQIDRAHNKDLANKDFKDLPKETRQKILDYEFSVHVLPVSVGDREVLQIFARMNSTGYKLNSQELRNAGYFGEFKTSMFEIASEQLPRWRSWGAFSEDSIARMQEVEFTSEIAQLMLVGIAGKSQSSLDRLYKDKNRNYPERREVERRFRFVLDTTDDLLGSALARSGFRKRTLLYALLATVYDAAFGIGSRLIRTKPRQLPRQFARDVLRGGRKIERKRAPVKVLDALARRTTHPESRKLVISYLRKTCHLE
jgi:hypothetical protein